MYTVRIGETFFIYVTQACTVRMYLIGEGSLTGNILNTTTSMGQHIKQILLRARVAMRTKAGLDPFL